MARKRRRKGKRIGFKKLKSQLARRRGKRKVRNPGGLAAYIGRKKYGKKKFQRMAAKGRKRRRRR